MSWSVAMVGKASNVIKALKEESEKLTDQSKVEFDSALPHFIGIIKENFSINMEEPTIEFTASGHGYAQADQQISRQCVCSIKTSYIRVV